MSLTTEDIEDIKQLLVANNRALMVEIDQTLDQKLDDKLEQKLKPLEERLNKKFEKLSAKCDDLHEFVSESLTVSNDANGERLADHQARLTKLEQATA